MTLDLIGLIGLICIIGTMFNFYYSDTFNYKDDVDVDDDPVINVPTIQRLPLHEFDKYYSTLEGYAYLDQCYPTVSDQFADMFSRQPPTHNLGFRIGDLPPDSFY